MNYQATLFDPVYLLLGVPAVITLADGTFLDDLTAMDKTIGIDVGGGDVQVQTIVPAAMFRVAEIHGRGVVLDRLPKASLLMSGFEWRVQSYRVKPSARGEKDGEVILLLTQKRELSSESELASEP